MLLFLHFLFSCLFFVSISASFFKSHNFVFSSSLFSFYFFSFSFLNFLLSSMYSLLPIFSNLYLLYILCISLFFLIQLLSHQSLCSDSNLLVFTFLLIIVPCTIFLILCHFSSTPFWSVSPVKISVFS